MFKSTSLEKKIDSFFSEKISIIILLLVATLTVALSTQIYIFENTLLQDAVFYISTAENPKNYFTVPHQNALRIFPSILVYFLKFSGISTDNCFKYLTFILFIFLHLKTFFLLKSYKFKNYLAISAIAILFYSSHSVIYTIFNYYQLLDLLTYILIIYFIQLNKTYDLKILFFVSLISMFTKEYLLILICITYLRYFISYKKRNTLLSFLLILIVFTIHYNLASSHNLATYENKNVLAVISSFFEYYIYGNFNVFINSINNGLIADKNIFLFMPFSLLIFSRSFIKILIKNYAITLYACVPLAFSILLFYNVGNNFFRVFYHGYLIILILCIVFLNKIILNDDTSKILFFISPACLLIDYIYIVQNINQHGFYNFFQYDRYSYFSGYYLFNLIFIFIVLKNFKNIFLKTYKQNIHRKKI
tara:strand:+ start:125 stop:1381 length:1257 start_codon:yes stop_codon:yes gene_type:complete